MSKEQLASDPVMQRIESRSPKDWILACHRVCRRTSKCRGVPLWSFVSELTSHGSGYSMDICHRFGWNPHAPAHRPIS